MKKLFVKQTEVNSGGSIRLSIYKQIYDPTSGELLHEEPHLVPIFQLDDFDQRIAEVEAHLATEGYPPIDPEELTLPKSLRAAAHRHPMVKTAVHEARERAREEQERMEAEREAEERRLAAEAEAAERERQEAEDRRRQEIAAAVEQVLAARDERAG